MLRNRPVSTSTPFKDIDSTASKVDENASNQSLPLTGFRGHFKSTSDQQNDNMTSQLRNMEGNCLDYLVRKNQVELKNNRNKEMKCINPIVVQNQLLFVGCKNPTGLQKLEVGSEFCLEFNLCSWSFHQTIIYILET